MSDKRRKLNAELAEVIRRQYSQQKSIRSIAKEHGVTRRTIQQVILGLTYKK